MPTPDGFRPAALRAAARRKRSAHRATAWCFAALLQAMHGAAVAQEPLSLEAARAAARRMNPALAAARAAVDVAAGNARQAGAFPNPSLSWGHEQSAREGATNAQDIVSLEQRIEFAARSARMEGARYRLQAAELRLEASLAELDFEVAQAWANAWRAGRHATLADSARQRFREATRVTAERLAAGDVSGYESRRVALEAARYTALAAQAQGEARAARLRLATLTGVAPDVDLPQLTLHGSPDALHFVSADSAAALAIAHSPALRAAELEATAAHADLRLTRSRRVPAPLLSAGYKNDRVPGQNQALRGFVAGVSFSLPFWDRTAGAIDAAAADARRVAADALQLRLNLARQARDAFSAAAMAAEQAASLAPLLGEEAQTMLIAAQTAYAEGEITLLEFLDTLRAHREAEAAFASVIAESIIQRAALERLLGVALLP